MARSAAVAQLKAKLSEYLARVKAGEEVIVTKRGRPIARIVPLSRDAAAAAAELGELARAGLVRIGSGRLPAGFWKMPRPRPARGAGGQGVVGEPRPAAPRLRRGAQGHRALGAREGGGGARRGLP